MSVGDYVRYVDRIELRPSQVSRSLYFIRKIYLYFSIGNDQPGKPALC